MIAIINRSPNKFTGVCRYDLMINNKLVATFEHLREEGLAVCLKKASEAAEKAKWEDVVKLVEAIGAGAKEESGGTLSPTARLPLAFGSP